jgi:hypothetical protein
VIPPLGNSANCELHRGGAIGDILERISCDRWICLQARAFDLKMGRAGAGVVLDYMEMQLL